MSLARRLLPIRRIWWFLTDWHTWVTFRISCPHCGGEIAHEGIGLLFRRAWHDASPVCKFTRWYRPPPHDWRRCGHCFMDIWHRSWNMERFYVVNRWRFRNKYNWGITE